MSVQPAASPRVQVDSHLKVGLALLALYLAVRFWLTAADALGYWGVTSGYRQWVADVHTYGSLACAMALILWERKRLAQFHIDGLVLAFIAFGPIVEKALGPVLTGSLAAVHWPKLTLDGLFLLALVLLAVKPRWPARKALVWLAVGLAAGLVIWAYLPGARGPSPPVCWPTLCPTR